MITSKNKLNHYLLQDALATGRTSTKAHLFGDEIWKWQRCLRKLEYYTNTGSRVLALVYRFRVHRLSIKLGYEIPLNVCEEGLSLPHRGPIVVGHRAGIGKFCRIHEGVTIGATNGSDKCAVIGNNVFIASGAKIIGDISIASDVAIGANAVVTKSISESGTTWGGIPAKKISDNDSHSNLRFAYKEDPSGKTEANDECH